MELFIYVNGEYIDRISVSESKAGYCIPVNFEDALLDRIKPRKDAVCGLVYDCYYGASACQPPL